MGLSVLIALQMAVAAAGRVRTVVCLEPPPPFTFGYSEQSTRLIGQAIGRARAAFAAGDAEAGIHAWLDLPFGPG